jgi:alpha/beta superfamily hydrolase
VARRIESLFVPGPAGRLEALLEEPHDRTARAVAVVCHPHPLYGGTMHNKVAFRAAKAAVGAGLPALRFNFRGVGLSEGQHANLTGEIEDARGALGWLRERYPALPFALAGFSFGAQAITRLGCELGTAQFLMAAGFPTRTGSADYMASCRTPKIFIQSTHDEFGPRPALEAFFETLPEPKRLEWVEAADHFFAGGLDQLEERVFAACEAGI